MTCQSTQSTNRVPTDGTDASFNSATMQDYLVANWLVADYWPAFDCCGLTADELPTDF